MKKHEKLYIPISVLERLPELTENNGLASKTVGVIINEKKYREPGKCWGDPAGEYTEEIIHPAFYTKDGWCWEYGELMNKESFSELTHWLEEKEEVITLSMEELEECYLAGVSRACIGTKFPQLFEYFIWSYLFKRLRRNIRKGSIIQLVE